MFVHFSVFRYCDAGYPISVKFIDLQAMRYGSCVLDVMHVLFTSSRPVIYEKHFHPLLSEYYDSLVKNLRNLGESPDFTFDEFKAEFKWRIFFGILVACLMLTCVTRTSPAKSIDAESTAKKLANDSEVEKIYESLKPGYHERLRSLFLTLTDFDLIWSKNIIFLAVQNTSPQT